MSQHTYKLGDKVLVIGTEYLADPPVGSVAVVVGLGLWAGQQWPVCIRVEGGWGASRPEGPRTPARLCDIRLATPEEIARAQLASGQVSDL